MAWIIGYVPISVGGCCGRRTLVSEDETAELLIAANVALILAFGEGGGETVDDLGLVSSES